MRQKSKVAFLGFTIVRMYDTCTRETERFFRDGRLVAILQKNGNVAISSSGIFDDEKHPRARYAVALCLHGLKLIGSDALDAAKCALDAHSEKLDIETLKYEAQKLGFSLIQKSKTRRR